MKVVINDCFGGFSLSPKAVKELAKLNGKECYFYKSSFSNGDITHKPINLEEDSTLFWDAFTVPNLDEVLPKSFRDKDGTFTSYNKLYEELSLDPRPDDRSDPKLISVVEKLGPEANGRHAELKIVEIPDGVEYQIDEYDGMESIHETHRSWS